MLQEVLSGTHENMSALENTLMLRVSEFVTAMNEVTASTGEATSRVETDISSFRDITSRVITDLGQLADQFDSHGRDLAKAADMIDLSNRRTEDTINERRVFARFAGRHARHPHRRSRSAAQALLRPAR